MQLHIYACAIRILAKGYLPISLITPLTLSTPRGTDGSFQPVPSMTIVLFVVTALPCHMDCSLQLSLGIKNRF